MQIEIPTRCPCCSSNLETVNDQLFCRNPSCEAQINKKIEHFTRVLGIKGFGPKTVEKLNLTDITELFYLDKDELIQDLGSEKVALKLLDEIERAKGADLATVLEAFSIPMVGNTASKKIASVVNSIEEITQDTCKEAGLGDKVTSNLLDWIYNDFIDIKEFLPFSFKSVKVVSNTNGPTVCITGKLSSFKTKAEATKELELKGYKVLENVNKNLSYLVDEGTKGSVKRQKAEEYGVTIISNLKDFLK